MALTPRPRAQLPAELGRLLWVRTRRGPGARSPRWGGGAGTKGRRTAEPFLNKDWVGGGLSLGSPPPAAPAAPTQSEAGGGSMAGARAALPSLLLQLASLALAARGESGRPACAPTSVSAPQSVGRGQTASPAPPGLPVPGRPRSSLSPYSPSVGEQSRGRGGQAGDPGSGRVLMPSLPRSPEQQRSRGCPGIWVSEVNYLY